jgi:membrane-bound serine protease (ClpP class)
MTPTLTIIVIVIGLLLLTLEIVALPGGISGIFGMGLLIFGVWQSFIQLGMTGGTIVLCCCVAICIILLAIFMKSKTWKKFSLNEESDSAVNQVSDPSLSVGTRGKTIARLAPTGKALIDGKLMEVHAVNKFIDQDKEIEVVAIEGYRIDVCEVEDRRFEQEA